MDYLTCKLAEMDGFLLTRLVSKKENFFELFEAASQHFVLVLALTAVVR